MLDKLLFYFFAGVAVASAVLMVTRRNVVHSAIFLITALLATAGIFLQLRAEFLFIVQIILYVGGIMVLFVFVIMLVNLDVALQQIQFARQKWVALLVALALAAQVGLMFWSSGKMPGQGLPVLTAAVAEHLPPNSETVAHSLFESYLLPFEIASVLLLVVLMSIELILNAVNINLVAFSRLYGDVAGQVFALFIIADAAAEAAVGLGIIIAFFRNRETVLADEMDLLKW